MINKIKWLNTLLVCSFLTACGGGGESGGGSSTPPPVNNAPSISLSVSSLAVDELNSGSIDVTVSDAETDSSSLTVSVLSSNSDILSVSYESGVISLTAQDVSGDQTVNITAKVSDGSKSSTAIASISIVDISGLIPAPIISMDSTAQVAINQTVNLSYQVAYDESATFQSESVSSADESLLRVELVNQQVEMTGVTVGQTSYIYTVTDSNNNTSDITVNVNVLATPAPIVTIDNVDEVGVNNSKYVEYNVELADGVSVVSSEITVSDNNLLEATLEAGKIKLVGKALGTATFTYTTIDSNGAEGSASQTVTIIEHNVLPDITLAGLDEDGVLVIYSNSVTEIPVIITDPDNIENRWYLSKLEGTENNPDAVLDYINGYHTDFDNKLLTIDAKQTPGFGYTAYFDLELTVEDSHSTVVKNFTLILTQRPNGFPLFSFEGLDENRGYVPEGTTKTFPYVITDDKPENVVVTGYKHWHGDETQFDVILDTEAQTITINNHSVPLSEHFGILLEYKDGNYGGQASFNFVSSIVFAELQNNALAFAQRMQNKMSALHEYIYVAEFYAQVLENLNMISAAEAMRLVRATEINDNFDYIIAKNTLYNLEYGITSGSMQDEGEINAYMLTIEDRIDNATLSFGKDNINYVNELATLSQGLLPALTFEDSINEYDDEFFKYSRFAGNSTYGDYVEGNWVFKPEYKFMQAVIEKSFSQAIKVSSH